MVHPIQLQETRDVALFPSLVDQLSMGLYSQLHEGVQTLEDLGRESLKIVHVQTPG